MLSRKPYVFSAFSLYMFWHEHKAGMLIYILADQEEKSDLCEFWIKVRVNFVTRKKRNFLEWLLPEGNISVRLVAQRQWNKFSSSCYPHFAISCTTAAQNTGLELNMPYNCIMYSDHFPHTAYHCRLLIMPFLMLFPPSSLYFSSPLSPLPQIFPKSLLEARPCPAHSSLLYFCSWIVWGRQHGHSAKGKVTLL